MRPPFPSRRGAQRSHRAQGSSPGVRRLAAWLCATVALTLCAGLAAQEPSANASLVAAARAGDGAAMARALAAGATPNARNRLGESALLLRSRTGGPILPCRCLLPEPTSTSLRPTA